MSPLAAIAARLLKRNKSAAAIPHCDGLFLSRIMDREPGFTPAIHAETRPVGKWKCKLQCSCATASGHISNAQPKRAVFPLSPQRGRAGVRGENLEDAPRLSSTHVPAHPSPLFPP